ncbi:MAG: phage holin family protein [Chloroflexi bacterium]|nr:phage holin family protein [Chloroflexota bacterium]
MRAERIEGLGWADLIRRLANNVALIVDKQIDLAKEEAREDFSHALRGAMLAIVGAVLLLSAWVSFIVTGIFLISRAMPDWLAALIVGIFFLVVGVLVLLIGKARLQVKPLAKTRESLREDVEWVKRQPISSGR